MTTRNSLLVGEIRGLLLLYTSVGLLVRLEGIGKRPGGVGTDVRGGSVEGFVGCGILELPEEPNGRWKKRVNVDKRIRRMRNRKERGRRSLYWQLSVRGGFLPKDIHTFIDQKAKVANEQAKRIHNLGKETIEKILPYAAAIQNMLPLPGEPELFLSETALGQILQQSGVKIDAMEVKRIYDLLASSSEGVSSITLSFALVQANLGEGAVEQKVPRDFDEDEFKRKGHSGGRHCQWKKPSWLRDGRSLKPSELDELDAADCKRHFDAALKNMIRGSDGTPDLGEKINREIPQTNRTGETQDTAMPGQNETKGASSIRYRERLRQNFANMSPEEQRQALEFANYTGLDVLPAESNSAKKAGPKIKTAAAGVVRDTLGYSKWDNISEDEDSL